MCWIDICFGSHDVIVHDSGKMFLRAAFRADKKLQQFRAKPVSAESGIIMYIVEQYHALFRRV